MIKSKCNWSIIPFVREFKLHQLLSPIAIEQLDLYIEQVIDLGKDYHNNINGFKKAFSQTYKTSVQKDLFDNF